MSLSTILTILTGRQHYFKVKMIFYPNPAYSEKYTSRVATIGLTDRSDISDERLVKKALVGNLVTNYIKTHPQPCDGKGVLLITETYYLGWFGKPKGFKKMGDEAKKLNSKFSRQAVTDAAFKGLSFVLTGALWITGFIGCLVLWNNIRG